MSLRKLTEACIGQIFEFIIRIYYFLVMGCICTKQRAPASIYIYIFDINRYSNKCCLKFTLYQYYKAKLLIIFCRRDLNY